MFAELASMLPLAAADYEYANRAVGPRPAFIVGWLISVGNIIAAGSRMIYGMSSDGALPGVLARVHPRWRTPVPAILVSLAIAMAFASIGKLAFIAGATSFTIFAGFFSVCVALIVLRLRAPDWSRAFRAPFDVKGVSVLLVSGIAVSAGLTLGLEGDVLLVGAILLATGLLVMAPVPKRTNAAGR